ncbi:MAG: hypothetical protein JST26_07630 [Bacteroidetes bacterium]|nr:hypothetical protein [Bacteroidota bacterium]
MNRFPTEFEDLLNNQGKAILKNGYAPEDKNDRKRTPIDVLSHVIDTGKAMDCVNILQKTFYKSMKPISSKIDTRELTGMRKNYSERLSKNLRMKTLEIGSSKSKSYELAKSCGLMDMLNSESLKIFGEKVANTPFGSAENNQIICYQHGDYVSPHNDHHPENPNVRNGYFDIHIMFSNPHVQHQLLVYEKKGFLNGTYNIASPAAIAVYRLPFWHYTTPMLGKKGYEDQARRWLLLRSFEMGPVSKKTK